MQWHPLFAKMLRTIVDEHFSVETNVPVGDAPRAADIVLLRRTDTGPLPYRGLLRHLTTWNVIEFKGRSVSPRVRDLDLLVELGLGIDRRLNEERTGKKQRPLKPAQTSFWYIVNHFGELFLREARRRLGALEEIDSGVWRGHMLLRPVFLVDSMTVPVEPESVPVLLAADESREVDLELARIIVEEPRYWDLFGPLLSVLHPKIWKEARVMARARKKLDGFDMSPLIEEVGLEKYLEVVKISDFIDYAGAKNILKELGVKGILANLTPEERQKLKEQLK